MRMFDELPKKEDVIETIGDRQGAKARSSGFRSPYADPSVGDGSVEEKLDGARILDSHLVMTKPGMHSAE